MNAQQAIRMRLYAPFALGAVLFAVYAGYWLWAKAQLGRATAQFVVAQRERGVEFDYSRLQINGFPYRLTMIFTKPSAQFDTQWQWRGERLVIHILPYNLNQLEVDLSRGEHVITEPNGNILRLHADRIFGRAQVSRGRLVDLGLEATNLAISGKAGSVRADSIISFAQINRDYPGDIRLALAVRAGLWKPLPGFVSFLGPDVKNFQIGVEFKQGAKADILQSLFSPKTLRLWADAGGITELKQMIVDWAPLRLHGEGSVRIDDLRRLTGRLSLKMEDVKPLFEAMSDADWASPDAGTALRSAAVLSVITNGKLPVDVELDGGTVKWGRVNLFAIPPIP